VLFYSRFNKPIWTNVAQTTAYAGAHQLGLSVDYPLNSCHGNRAGVEIIVLIPYQNKPYVSSIIVLTYGYYNTEINIDK
jgi:hypothetical protein